MTSTHRVTVRCLEPGDDRTGLISGHPELDHFFQRFAGQNQFRHHLGVTYIALVANKIVGFVTVSVGEIASDPVAELIHKRLPAYPLPILRIARLATDQRCRGLGIGRELLRAMLELALEMRDRVGCVGVIVDAKPEAVTFYRPLGFQPLNIVSGALGDHIQPIPMFLPVQAIAKAKPVRYATVSQSFDDQNEN